MSIDLRLLEILEKRRRAELQQGAPPTGTGGGGEPPRDDGVERRLRVLESSFHSIDKTLAVIVEQLKHVASRDDVHSVRGELAIMSEKLDTKAAAIDLATLSGKLDTKASATDLAELKGRVARIPTVPTLTSILVFISLLFAAVTWALRHLPEPWARAL